MIKGVNTSKSLLVTPYHQPEIVTADIALYSKDINTSSISGGYFPQIFSFYSKFSGAIGYEYLMDICAEKDIYLKDTSCFSETIYPGSMTLSYLTPINIGTISAYPENLNYTDFYCSGTPATLVIGSNLINSSTDYTTEIVLPLKIIRQGLSYPDSLSQITISTSSTSGDITSKIIDVTSSKYSNNNIATFSCYCAAQSSATKLEIDIYGEGFIRLYNIGCYLSTNSGTPYTQFIARSNEKYHDVLLDKASGGYLVNKYLQFQQDRWEDISILEKRLQNTTTQYITKSEIIPHQNTRPLYSSNVSNAIALNAPNPEVGELLTGTAWIYSDNIITGPGRYIIDIDYYKYTANKNYMYNRLTAVSATGGFQWTGWINSGSSDVLEIVNSVPDYYKSGLTTSGKWVTRYEVVDTPNFDTEFMIYTNNHSTSLPSGSYYSGNYYGATHRATNGSFYYTADEAHRLWVRCDLSGRTLVRLNHYDIAKSDAIDSIIVDGIAHNIYRLTSLDGEEVVNPSEYYVHNLSIKSYSIPEYSTGEIRADVSPLLNTWNSSTIPINGLVSGSFLTHSGLIPYSSTVNVEIQEGPFFALVNWPYGNMAGQYNPFSVSCDKLFNQYWPKIKKSANSSIGKIQVGTIKDIFYSNSATELLSSGVINGLNNDPNANNYNTGSYFTDIRGMSVGRVEAPVIANNYTAYIRSNYSGEWIFTEASDWSASATVTLNVANSIWSQTSGSLGWGVSNDLSISDILTSGAKMTSGVSWSYPLYSYSDPELWRFTGSVKLGEENLISIKDAITRDSTISDIKYSCTFPNINNFYDIMSQSSIFIAYPVKTTIGKTKKVGI